MDAKALLKTAKQQLQDSQFEQALDSCKRAIRADGSVRFNALLIVGMCFLKMESFDKAEQAYAEAVKLKEGDLNPWMGLFQVHKQSQNHNGIVSAAEKLIPLLQAEAKYASKVPEIQKQFALSLAATFNYQKAFEIVQSFPPTQQESGGVSVASAAREVCAVLQRFVLSDFNARVQKRRERNRDKRVQAEKERAEIESATAGRRAKKKKESEANAQAEKPTVAPVTAEDEPTAEDKLKIKAKTFNESKLINLCALAVETCADQDMVALACQTIREQSRVLTPDGQTRSNQLFDDNELLVALTRMVERCPTYLDAWVLWVDILVPTLTPNECYNVSDAFPMPKHIKRAALTMLHQHPGQPLTLTLALASGFVPFSQLEQFLALPLPKSVTMETHLKATAFGCLALSRALSASNRWRDCGFVAERGLALSTRSGFATESGIVCALNMFRAVSCVRQYRPNVAQECLSSVLAHSPQFVAALKELAKVHVAMGSSEASTHIDTAKRVMAEENKHGAHVWGLLWSGWDLFLRGEVQTAEQMLRECLENIDSLDADEIAEANFRLGRVLWDKGLRNAEVKRLFMEAVRIGCRPSHPPALLYLGLWYLHSAQGKPANEGEKATEAAKKCLSKCIALDASIAVAGVLLGKLYVRSNQHALARALYIESTRQGTGHRWAWLSLGQLRMTKDEYTEALTALQQAIRTPHATTPAGELPPPPNDNWQSFASLGVCYLNLGKYTAAIKALTKALELHPSQETQENVDDTAVVTPVVTNNEVVKLLRTLAQSQLALGLSRDCATNCELILAHHPQDVVAAVLHAQALLKTSTEETGTGQHTAKQAVELLSSAAVQSRCSHVVMVHKLLGDALCAGALQSHSVVASCATAPQKGAEEEGLVASSVRETNLKQASIAYMKAIHLDPTNHASWCDLAHSLSLKADNNERHTKTDENTIGQAKRAARNALSLAPQDWQVWNLLGILERDPLIKQHCFIQAIQLEPKTSHPWTNLGVLYMAHNDIDLSSHCFIAANTADPTNEASWAVRGVELEIQSRNHELGESSANALRESFRAYAQGSISAKQTVTHSRLGAARTALLIPESSTSEALTHVSSMLSVFPLHPEALFLKGLLLERQGLYSEAEICLVLAEKYTPKSDSHLKEATVASLARVRVVSGSSQNIPANLGQWEPIVKALACADKDLQKAISQLHQIKSPELRARGALVLARFLIANHKPELQVAAALQAGVAEDGKNLKIDLALGVWSIDNNLKDIAKECLLRLSSIPPSETAAPFRDEAWLLDAHIAVVFSLHVLLGNYKQAIAFCAHAVHSNPHPTRMRHKLFLSALSPATIFGDEHTQTWIAQPVEAVTSGMPRSKPHVKFCDEASAAAMSLLLQGEHALANKMFRDLHHAFANPVTYAGLLISQVHSLLSPPTPPRANPNVPVFFTSRASIAKRAAANDTASVAGTVTTTEAGDDTSTNVNEDDVDADDAASDEESTAPATDAAVQANAPESETSVGVAGSDQSDKKRIEHCYSCLATLAESESLEPLLKCIVLLTMAECKSALGDHATAKQHAQTASSMTHTSTTGKCTCQLKGLCLWVSGRMSEREQRGQGRTQLKSALALGCAVCGNVMERNGLLWTELAMSYALTGHIEAAIFCSKRVLSFSSTTLKKRTKQLMVATKAVK